MWVQRKVKSSSIILSLDYKDFAFIEVEKNKKGSVDFYTINFEIYDICSNSFVFYKMNEISTCLTILKEEIEKLYRNIYILNDEELEAFIDSLLDKIDQI